MALSANGFARTLHGDLLHLLGTVEDPEHAAPSDAWTSRQATFTAEGDTAELIFVVGDHTVDTLPGCTLFLDDVTVQVSADAGKYVAATAQEDQPVFSDLQYLDGIWQETAAAQQARDTIDNGQVPHVM